MEKSSELSPLLRYLYWNMNYHTEHHMYAAVPFFNLPKLRAAIERDCPPAHASFGACLSKLYDIKAEQESNSGYIWTPSFPPGAAAPRLT